MIVFANLTNIIFPTNIKFRSIIDIKLRSLTINISYISNSTTNNTLDLGSFYQVEIALDLDIVISNQSNRKIGVNITTTSIHKECFIDDKLRSFLNYSNIWIIIAINNSCVSRLICLRNTRISGKTNSIFTNNLESQFCWTSVFILENLEELVIIVGRVISVSRIGHFNTFNKDSISCCEQCGCKSKDWSCQCTSCNTEWTGRHRDNTNTI